LFMNVKFELAVGVTMNLIPISDDLADAILSAEPIYVHVRA